MRLLLLADLHLGHPLEEWGDRAEARANLVRQSLVDAVDLALDAAEGIQAVLIAGDLFDRPDPRPELQNFVMEQLARLDQGGRPVVLLPGNHDALSHSRCVYPNLEFPGTVTLVNWPRRTRVEIPVGEETLHLYSLTWVPGRTPQSPFEGLVRHETPGAHVGLLHARLESEPVPGEVPIPLLVSPSLLAGSRLDLVVLGRPHDYCEQRCGETVVVSPGSPVGLSFEEPGDRYFTVAEIDASGVRLDARRRDLEPVVALTVDVGSGPEEVSLAGRIGKLTSHAALARVVLRGSVSRPLSMTALAAALPPNGPRVHLVDETQLCLEVPPGATDPGERSVRELFLDEMKHRLDDAKSPEDRARIDDARRIVLEAFTRSETHHAH